MTARSQCAIDATQLNRPWPRPPPAALLEGLCRHRQARGSPAGSGVDQSVSREPTRCPELGRLLGHEYPAAPTFGLPCPTTIFTLGLFLWVQPRMPLAVVIIPAAWAVVGSVAALQLGVGEDAGLAVSAVLALPLLVRHSRRLTPTTAGVAARAGH